MADTPLIYGSYSSNMYPVIPDGETTVGHNTFGKDRINPEKRFEFAYTLVYLRLQGYLQCYQPKVAGRSCLMRRFLVL